MDNLRHDMMMSLVTAIGAGVVLISISRRFNLPSIVMLLLGGILLGPEAFGLVKPDTLAIDRLIRRRLVPELKRGHDSSQNFDESVRHPGLKITGVGSAVVDPRPRWNVSFPPAIGSRYS